MNTGNILRILFLYTTLTGIAAAELTNPPETTVDGLHRVTDTEMAYVYAKPAVDLAVYNRILLLEPHVAFTKNWLGTQNSIPNQLVRPQDMERIKSDLADLFMEVFKLELQNNGGYVLVDGVADDVLMVRPAIIDLNVIAPDTPGTRGTRSAITSAGSMTLYMELMDSVTGDMLVKAMDFKFDRSRTRIQASNRVRNEGAARDILGHWAELLRMGLDEARTVVSTH